MSDTLIAALLMFLSVVVSIFTALFSKSSLFSNRWVTNRGAKRFFSLAWSKAGERSTIVGRGIFACCALIAVICAFGREWFLFPVVLFTLLLLSTIVVNIIIEVRGGRGMPHYWKKQLARPRAMYFDVPMVEVNTPRPSRDGIVERWRLACMRAGLEDIANIDGDVSTPPVLKHGENEIIVNPMGFHQSDFIKAMDKLSMTLGKKIYDVTFIEHGRMRISLEKRPLPEMLRLDEISLVNAIVFGESVNGPVHVHPSKWPHMMVAGTSGSGKSIFLRFICYQIMKHFPDAVIGIIDVKREDFEVFERWPNFVRARNSEHLTTLAKRLEQERNRRENTRRKDWGDVFFIIDEANEAITKASTRNVERLLTMSRSADMHMLLCQQRSTISDTSVTGVMRANATMRICFRVDNAADSRVMLNTPAGMKIPMIPGRAIVLDRNTGKNITVQSPFVSAADVDRLIDEMLPRCKPQPLAAEMRQLIIQTDQEAQ